MDVLSYPRSPRRGPSVGAPHLDTPHLLLSPCRPSPPQFLPLTQEYIDHIEEIVSWLGWAPYKVRRATLCVAVRGCAWLPGLVKPLSCSSQHAAAPVFALLFFLPPYPPTPRTHPPTHRSPTPRTTSTSSTPLQCSSSTTDTPTCATRPATRSRGGRCGAVGTFHLLVCVPAAAIRPAGQLRCIQKPPPRPPYRPQLPGAAGAQPVARPPGGGEPQAV